MGSQGLPDPLASKAAEISKLLEFCSSLNNDVKSTVVGVRSQLALFLQLARSEEKLAMVEQKHDALEEQLRQKMAEVTNVFVVTERKK